MNKPSTFAKRLRELLDETGMKQAELSRKSGVNKSSITHYLKGDYEAKQDVVYAIAACTGVSEAWLMGYDVPMERHSASLTEKAPVLTPKDERDIANDLENALSKLSDESALMFDGEPLDDETRELLRISLENQFRMAKIIAKQKYTPKKYRKNQEG